MKRRREISSRVPLKIRSSSIRGFNGVRSDRESNDIIREKGVKLKDPQIDCSPDIRPNAYTMQHDAAVAPGSNAPKTSEYAFFTKLKKDAGWSRCTPSLKEDYQMKHFERSGCPAEITKTTNTYDELRSSWLIEKDRPITHNLSLSPRTNASKSLEATTSVKNIHEEIKSPFFNVEVKPINNNLLHVALGGALKHSGAECSAEGVFSAKRKKLRKWVAQTSLPKVEELSSEGSDLVPVLLSRLFPHSNEYNSCRDANPSQLRADPKYLSHGSPQSDAYDAEFHWTPRRDHRDNEWFFGDLHKRTQEVVPLRWDARASESSSTSYTARHHFPYENEEFGSDYEGETASLITLRDPYFSCSSGSYGYTSSTDTKELNKSRYLDESAIGRGPRTLLLGWEFDNMKDGDLSITTHEEQTYSCSTLATVWDEHGHILDNKFDAGGVYSSSYSSRYPSKFTSPPQPYSADLDIQDVGRFLEEDKFLIAELKHFPLSLSVTPRYLHIWEDSYTLNSYEGINTVSPQDPHGLIRRGFREKDHPDSEALLIPFGPSLDLGWKCLPRRGFFGEVHSCTYHNFQSSQGKGPSSHLFIEDEQVDYLYSLNHEQTIAHFAEDTVDDNGLSSISYSMPLKKMMALPLLLDSSSWHKFDEDEHYDNDKRINF